MENQFLGFEKRSTQFILAVSLLEFEKVNLKFLQFYWC